MSAPVEEKMEALSVDGSGQKKEGGKKKDKASVKAERLAARQSAQATAKASAEESDPLAANYGDLPLEALQSKEISGRKWTKIEDLSSDLDGSSVLIRGRVHNVRAKGKMGFIIIRDKGMSVQVVLSVGDNVSKGMVKYVSSLTKESIVDVEGIVKVPEGKIESTTQQVEIDVRKVFTLSKSAATLPLNIEDAGRREVESEEGGDAQFVKVNQDTRLNNRVLDLRTAANQAIFRVQSQVCQLWREFLLRRNFIEIHTPKLIAGSSEGGASVFKLDYKGTPACLAQSPQLYKQMCICADFGRVFEIGPVFRAEDAFTRRHLCEFTGLDFEMEIKEHYFEVLDILDGLFINLFEGLNKRCKAELEAINRQYPFEPLQFSREVLRLTFAEGVALLQEAGFEVDPYGDLSTETERSLGQLVKQKYKTDFYVLHRYPLGARPFYTMPAVDDPRYTNSFDIFIRGEEIISGAQRIHEPEFLAKRATECGIDVSTISSYIDSFRYGAPPHGGCGVGLERVIMLFCGLNNIRKTSMYPRDPKRLTP
eukprot:TRINITY_DN980_c0_g1_i1.p1 TRINITY_DN980_c0_g1~~TRINITY_DN980_c0_g1_i1.p1  ORF type:complete len:538 (+),score=117.08 TRINITY_DN980_c0_g1_i1:232-1845(+)